MTTSSPAHHPVEAEGPEPSAPLTAPPGTVFIELLVTQPLDFLPIPVTPGTGGA